jgi:hypothetical protein
LYVDGEAHRVHDTGELHQRAVAHQLDHPAMMLGRLGLDQLSAKGLEGREGTRLIGRHQAAVADDIGGEDGGKPPFLVSRFHESLLQYRSAHPQTV